MRRSFLPMLATLLLVVVACTQAPLSDPPPAITPTPGPGDYGPAEIYFVNSEAGGPVFDGTLAYPFATLAAAVSAAGDGDILYVFAGRSHVHPYEAVALKPGQHLIGSGVAFPSANLAASTAPLIESDTGPAVTLARDNQVRGLQVRSASHGIVGTNVGALGLSDLLVEQAGGDGIRLSVGGTERAAIRSERLVVSGSGTIGFHLSVSDAASADLALASSSFRKNAGNAVQLTFEGTGDSTFAFDQLAIETLQNSGIRVFVGGERQQDVQGRIHGATVTSEDPLAAGNGLAVVVEGDATASVEIAGGRVERFGSFGIDLSARGGDGTLDATLVDTLVTDPAARGLAGVRMLAGNGVEDETNVLCLNLASSPSLQGAALAMQQESWPGAAIHVHPYAADGAVAPAHSLLESAIVTSASQRAHASGTFGFQAERCRLPAF